MPEKKMDLEDYPDLKDGDYLSVFIPAFKRALVFQVVTKANATTPTINFGALPFVSGGTLGQYGGGSVAIAANGAMPAQSFTTTGIPFPLTDPAGAYDTNDMWYTNEEFRDRIFYIVAKTTPGFLRIGLEYPKAVKNYRFQRDRVITGVDQKFGWSNGIIETVQFPNIHQGWLFGNDTNLPVYTGMKFKYNELIIRTPNDPQTIYEILTGDIPRYQVDLPISVMDASIEQSLVKDYGYMGFDTTILNDKPAALQNIATLLGSVLI